MRTTTPRWCATADVKAGQKIGTMGSTGTDSVFLHFQIRYRATALDPQRYLPPQGSSPSC